VKKSIFLKHDFGSFDDSADGIARLQLTFVGAATCDGTLDRILSDANSANSAASDGRTLCRRTAGQSASLLRTFCWARTLIEG